MLERLAYPRLIVAQLLPRQLEVLLHVPGFRIVAAGDSFHGVQNGPRSPVLAKHILPDDCAFQENLRSPLRMQHHAEPKAPVRSELYQESPDSKFARVAMDADLPGRQGGASQEAVAHRLRRGVLRIPGRAAA
jgi:hypothetical protein